MFYISGIYGSQIPYSPPDTMAVPKRGIAAVGSVTGVAANYSAAGPALDVAQSGDSSGELHAHVKNPYAHLDDPIPVREQAILASQIMTAPVITVPESSTVEHTWNLFRQKHFRHVPVVSEQGKLVGLVSDRDFLGLGLDHMGKELTRDQQLSSPIKEIMAINVLTTRPDNEIRLIAKVMFTENISAMPVVNDEESLVGIVTTNDILRTLVNREPLNLWT